jgi:UDP-N-acetylmuramoylalanine--D-glutamate ligase
VWQRNATGGVEFNLTSPSALKDQKVLVLGLGISGLAAAELAQLYGARVTVLDAKTSPDLEARATRLSHRGITVHLDWARDSFTDSVDLAILSPGIPPASVLGRLVAGLTCPVISELEFGFLASSCPILAITGTNGKTTTTELTTHLLKGAGKRVMAAGNVGVPLCEAARKGASLDFLVVEVSSFQMEACQAFAPLAAVFMNFTSDHMDRYASPSAYLLAKLKLFCHLRQPRQAIFKQELLALPEVAALPLFANGARPVTFSTETPGNAAADWALVDGQLAQRQGDRLVPLLPRSELRLLGDHNVENTFAALALCQAVGVPLAALLPHVKTFSPSAHRLEIVGSLNGVRYINDSKSTNPDALIQALKTAVSAGAKGKVHLIAGGRDKEMDFLPTVPYIKEIVKAAYLIGESRERLNTLWQGQVPCVQCRSLPAAVEAAADNAVSGDIVLLSPGFASFDMFSSYLERGSIFAQTVKRRLQQ